MPDIYADCHAGFGWGYYYQMLYQVAGWYQTSPPPPPPQPRAPIFDASFKEAAGCFVKGAAKGAVGTIVIGGIAVAVAAGAPVAAVTGALGLVAVAGGAMVGVDVVNQIKSGNVAGIAYDAGSVAGGAAVGFVGGGAIANGIRSPATSGWSPASWAAQRFSWGKGSIWNWLGTGPTAASGGMAGALAGAGGATAVKGGC
jgi:hypothetical protein